MITTIGKARRLSNMVNKQSGRILCVPLDHGLQVGPIAGLEHMDKLLDTVVNAGVDAIILNPGLFIRHAARLVGGPAVILRLDQTTMWRVGSPNGYSDTHTRLIATVEEAIQLGADAVITYLFTGNKRPELETRSFEICGQIATECRRWGIVHVIEAMAANGGLAEREDPDIIAMNCRMAGEMGADLIKTDYCNDASRFSAIAAQSIAPVLVAGGASLGSTDVALKFVETVISAGAKGIMFGRNVFQSKDPAQFLKEAVAIVHGAKKPVT